MLAGSDALGAFRIERLYTRTDEGSWIVGSADGPAGTFDLLEGRLLGGTGTLTSRGGSRTDGGRSRLVVSEGFSDSLTMRVEHSTDGGGTWGAAWTLRYVRDGAAPEGPSAETFCADAAYREFDFWLGNWSTADPNGAPGGTNDIRPRLGGCVLEENWAGSPRGTSFNMYDPRTGLWYQLWRDEGGLILVLQGELDEDGSMVLVGEGVGRPGRQRITWSPLADGRVRQLGESEAPGGGWTTSFELLYTRR